jgi:hypothetical protein
MPEWNLLPLLGFIIAVTIFTIVWGRILWYFDEKTNLLPRFIFYLMTYLRMTFPEIKSLLLSIIYYSFGII